jgi:hypothetical protein
MNTKTAKLLMPGEVLMKNNDPNRTGIVIENRSAKQWIVINWLTGLEYRDYSTLRNIERWEPQDHETYNDSP